MIIEIDKEGNVRRYPFELDVLNEIIKEKFDSLTPSYNTIKLEVEIENKMHPGYRSVFTGSTMQIPIEKLNSEKIGQLEDYSYYETIYMTEDFNILNSLRMRLTYFKEFSYLISDVQERLPYYLIQKLKEITKTS